MTTRVQTAHGGEQTVSQLPSNGGVSRSTDYQGQGITVRSAEGLGATRTIQNTSQAADSDLIKVGGMEITVAMARDMGLIDVPTDPSLSAGASATAAQQHAEATEEAESYGHEGFDQATAELNAKVDAGAMDHSEANEYQTAVGQIAMANLTVTEVTEAIDGLTDPAELSADHRAVVASVEAKVTQAATASAKAELGEAGFNRLSEMAYSSPEVNEALRQYAGLRAMGRADVSWAEFLQDAVDHVSGNR